MQSEGNKFKKINYNDIGLFILRRDSVVVIATGYGLDDGGVTVQVSVGADFSPLQVVRTGSKTHPAFYPMDNFSPG
jgi:hypothetical protein